MKTIESFLRGKRNDTLCEDGIYLGKSLIVVIDGVTAKSNNLISGETSGYLAKKILLDYIKNHEENLCKVAASEMFFELNKCLHIYAENHKLIHDDYPRACIASYNDVRHEVSGYGDCQIMINGELFGFEKKVDRINAEFRSLILEYELAGQSDITRLMEHDIGRDSIKDSLRRQTIFENKNCEYGYPVLNGLTYNPEMVFLHTVDSNTEVVLATDGYPFLKPTLNESERSLEDLLKEDPLCVRKYKSTKGLMEGNISYDDRAYWRGITT